MLPRVVSVVTRRSDRAGGEYMRLIGAQVITRIGGLQSRGRRMTRHASNSRECALVMSKEWRERTRMILSSTWRPSRGSTIERSSSFGSDGREYLLLRSILPFGETREVERFVDGSEHVTTTTNTVSIGLVELLILTTRMFRTRSSRNRCREVESTIDRVVLSSGSAGSSRGSAGRNECLSGTAAHFWRHRESQYSEVIVKS